MLVSRRLIRFPISVSNRAGCLASCAGDSGKRTSYEAHASNRQSRTNPAAIQKGRLHTYLGRFNPEV